jgi:hypothetical protein
MRGQDDGLRKPRLRKEKLDESVETSGERSHMTTEERVEKLEKELTRAKRRSRVMLVAVAMTVAGMFLLCAGNSTVQKVVRAEKFELVDPAGKIRATLGMLDSERVTTSRPGHDQDGKPYAAQVRTYYSASPKLSLCDSNGLPRVSLCVSRGDGESPELTLDDPHGEARVVLCLRREYRDGPCANPELRMGDSLGTDLIQLSTDGGWLGDRSGLFLNDSTGNIRAELSTRRRWSDGIPRLCMYGDDPTLARVELGMGLSGKPGLQLSDQNGVTRAQLGVAETMTPDGRITTHPESSLLLFGPDNKVIWQAP